jgi:hypothetical protein
MKTNRLWVLAGVILLMLPLVFKANAGDDRDEVKYRWDILHISSFTPVTAAPGGSASALANDNSKITLTGNGTFEPGEPEEVTGGGTWQTFSAMGALTGSGTYRVTKLVRFTVAPGLQTSGVVDNIPGAKGDLSDERAGLLIANVAYSDGSKGVLVVSCHLNGGPDFVARPAAPASIFEGITASKGFADYWFRVAPVGGVDGGRTLFHTIGEGEDRDNH